LNTQICRQEMTLVGVNNSLHKQSAEQALQLAAWKLAQKGN